MGDIIFVIQVRYNLVTMSMCCLNYQSMVSFIFYLAYFCFLSLHMKRNIYIRNMVEYKSLLFSVKSRKIPYFSLFLTWYNVIRCDWCNLTNPVTIWNVTGNKGKLLSLSNWKGKKYLSWNIKTGLEYEQIIYQHRVCSNILYLALLRH